MNYRIDAVKRYLVKVLDEILTSNKYLFNINFIDLKEESYSLNRIPTESSVTNWIIDNGIEQELYEFVSRKAYSPDVLDNLSNIGFFETLEKKIKDNNENSIYPEIKGIESIEVVTCGGIATATPDTCLFSIQIRIRYRRD